MREEGEEVCGGDERRDASDRGAQGPQAHSRRIRGPGQGAGPCRASDGQEGGVLAIRPVRRRCPSVRRWGVRQEGSVRVREERGGPAAPEPRTCELHGSALHHGIQ